ncbi:unnamed protein product [Didymodactylos carnosus]|uniref:Medium-chain acyl-CoA ligase ACSF2, mitochondrial n=1 Tax=Didymodactylos carnosus TaxID=1234261 RepID=A0A813W944_9BILA|nr:unnamed protein product [Didymodactylos carnosus]CAF0848865.1 unnamed protein product [Didymodactylos carnosus]CAF3497390.1 unnamed protein product [Didymodactylos carnosus]CAF3636543.1 unnamed protein product [Didymodactylos carnosus]
MTSLIIPRLHVRSAIREVLIYLKRASSSSTTTKTSYYHHASSLPFWNKTLGQSFDDMAEKYPADECYIFKMENKRYTFKSFKDEVNSIATSLLELGFETGDRLGVWLPNTSENVLLSFACSKLGIIKVNINPAYLEHEIKYCLNKVMCKGLVMQPNVKILNLLSTFTKLVPELQSSKAGDLKSQSVPSLKHVILAGTQPISGTHSFNELLNRGGNRRQHDLVVRQNSIDSDAPAAIYFTSGTTGKPKAATLTNFNMLNTAVACYEHIGCFFTRLCVPIPMFHGFAEIAGTLNACVGKSCMIYPAQLSDTELTMKAIQEEKCTALIGAPIIFRDILTHPNRKKYDLSSLDYAALGASPMSSDFLETLEKEIPIKRVSQGYGMTENSALLTSGMWAEANDRRRRTGSMGKPMQRIEIKLVNEKGETVALGEEGEIWARGYCVMKGYWNDEEKTHETLTESKWLKTGDIAVMDEDGYLFFRGRMKEMIIRGGVNIYPIEIENVIILHPKVAEAQVFGIPDKRYGEEVCAWIRLKPNEQCDVNDIQKFLSTRLAFFKIPKYMKIVDKFIMTPTGKVQKFRLSEMTVNDLNISKDS